MARIIFLQYSFLPMLKTDPIIGHTSLLSELERDLETGNISHAYLFSGPRHLGKMSVAHWFARELLSKGVSEEHLDERLKNIERLTHPDLIVLDQLWIEDVCDDWEVIARSSNAPQQHRAKKPAAKTNTISIDDIRALQDRLYETGTGQYRCCIIRLVDRMQPAAANALLKILEEPPEGLVFILTTASLSSLLPTIVSRTRVLRFRSLPKADLIPLLEGVPEEDKQFILRIVQGAPGVACSLRDNPDTLREHKMMYAKALSFWEARSLKERLQILTPIHKRGYESDQFLLHLSLALRERSITAGRVRAFHKLTRALKTNAHRQLLAQQFALSVS